MVIEFFFFFFFPCRPGLNKTLQTCSSRRKRRRRRRCQQGRNAVDTSQAYEVGPGINSKQNNTAVIPSLRLVVAQIDLHLICMKLNAVVLLRPDRSPSRPLPTPRSRPSYRICLLASEIAKSHQMSGRFVCLLPGSRSIQYICVSSRVFFFLRGIRLV